MCERCREERDDDYDGETIAEKRRQAIRSILRRHPELGVEPDDVTLRFAPKAEESCVRVNVGGQSPRYEIHVPESLGQAMSSSPPLSGIATVAWIASDRAHEEVCEILDASTSLQHGAFFVSDSPPMDPLRAGGGQGVYQYEQDVQERLTEDRTD